MERVFYEGNRVYEFEFFELGFLRVFAINICVIIPQNFHHFIITYFNNSHCFSVFNELLTYVPVSSHPPLNLVLVLILGRLLALIGICTGPGKASGKSTGSGVI